MTSTWSLGRTIEETLAAPVQLIETARIWRLTSAESPVADGSPPSISDQNTTSPRLCPISTLRPTTSATFSAVSACPRMPTAGTVFSPRSDLASSLPEGISRAKHRTSIVPYRRLMESLSAFTSASLAEMHTRVSTAASSPAARETTRTIFLFIRRVL